MKFIFSHYSIKWAECVILRCFVLIFGNRLLTCGVIFSAVNLVCNYSKITVYFISLLIDSLLVPIADSKEHPFCTEMMKCLYLVKEQAFLWCGSRSWLRWWTSLFESSQNLVIYSNSVLLQHSYNCNCCIYKASLWCELTAHRSCRFLHEPTFLKHLSQVLHANIPACKLQKLIN